MRRVIKGAQLSQERYRVEITKDPAPEERAEPMDALLAGAAIGQPAGQDAPSANEELQAVRLQALALLQQTRERATAIVDETQSRAEEMIDEAGRSVAALREQARAAGREAGYADGRAAADAQMRESVASLQALVEAARTERQTVLCAAEREIVRLAMVVASRVVHREIETDPRVVLDVARSAIARLSDKETMVVRVNPADLETMRSGREELFPGDARQIRFVGDLRVDRGGVVIDTEAGSVDGKIEHQLHEARKLLRLDDDDVTLDRQVSSHSVINHAEAS